MNEERLKLTDEDILDLAREYGKEDQEKVKLTVKELIQANEKELMKQKQQGLSNEI